MATLRKATISFHTHNDDRASNTVLHVFLKNRSNTSSTPEGSPNFIENFLEYNRYEAMGLSAPFEINPYLGFAQSISQGVSFGNPSTHQFDIPLRPRPIPAEEIVLPVVNIHILPDVQVLPGGNDRWIFDYTVDLLFDDNSTATFTSNTDGVTGIILDQDNKDHSGFGVETRTIPPSPIKLQTDAVLNRITLELATHNDDKKGDTSLNVHIVNRISKSSSQDISVVTDLLKGQSFDNPSYKNVQLPLASPSIRLADIVLPVVNINIGAGTDRWIFDYRVTFYFSNGHAYSSTTSGIILDQDNHKHTGAYQGTPFPVVAPLTIPTLSPVPINHLKPNEKRISLSFLGQKLDEFINHRQGTGSQSPIARIRLHNDGNFGALPQSYYDLQTIEADPPPPGTILPAGFQEGVRYDSSPTIIGQESESGIAKYYFNDVNSQKFTVKIDPTSATPIVVEIDFETLGEELLGSAGGVDFSTVSVTISLTLTFDATNHCIDLMSWVDQINNTSDDDKRENMKDAYVHVVMTAGTFDPGGAIQKKVRDSLFDLLSSRGQLNRATIRDSLNATVNSWLLGGVIERGNTSPLAYANPCRIQDAHIDGDNLVISYSGPQNTFQFKTPAGWPASVDFTPGTLANIDHIVVLTMENRSFDHMLGYLSLPVDKGGMGRTDIDGLKGGEFNLLDGKLHYSFAFAVGDTIFSPDPPHSFEPVQQAINSGKMDGFVQSYTDEHGPTAGPRIMGYHTAANLPIYDAMARDFAICNRWFASHPGPTFCNRFYELSGRLNIDAFGFWETSNSNPLRPVFTTTIFDHLSKDNVSWKYFEHGYCFLRFFEQYTFNSTNIATFTDPVFGFEAMAKAGTLPSVTFIDPHFIELPPDGNCDGPPANIADGQLLVKKVVEAVVSSPAWAKTLLIITYDEHGGFYDHVPPPPATKVSPESIGTYGVRVPTFVISPWVKGGSTFGRDGMPVVVGGGGQTEKPAVANAEAPAGAALPAVHAITTPLRSLYFDHTSILKTIARRFLSNDPPYMGDRFRDANDLSLVVGSTPQTPQFRPFIPYNLVYATSQKRLDVQGGSSAAGAMLWQYDSNTTPAQQFSLEDAGNGFFYIRTHTGNLYVTAVPAASAVQPGGIKQEPKYPPGGTGASSPDCQRWKFTSGAVTAVGSASLTISSAAFAGKVLQPSANSLASGTAVVLGDPVAAHVVTVNPNGWLVTSPLLPGNQQVFHA